MEICHATYVLHVDLRACGIVQYDANVPGYNGGRHDGISEFYMQNRIVVQARFEANIVLL